MDDITKSKYKLKQQEVLLESLSRRRTPDKTDAVLVCGEKKFHCHTAVLTASSPYFEAMFSKLFEEGSTRRVVYDVKDLEPQILECVIDFLYVGKLQEENCGTEEEMQKIYAAAHLMQLDVLTEYCVCVLSNMISGANWFTRWQLATLYSNQTLKTAVLRYILHNFGDVSLSDEFLKLSEEQIKELIQMVTGSCFLDQLLTSVLKWLTHDIPEREKLAANLIDSVDTKQVSQLCLKTLLSNEEMMNASETVANAMNKLAVGVFVFNKQTSLKRQTNTIRIRHRVENLAELKTCDRSLPKSLNGLNWRMEVECHKASGGEKGRKKGHRSLSVFLCCSLDPAKSCGSWSVNAEAHVKLLSQKTSVMPFIRSLNHVFGPSEPNWGWDYFFSWSNVLDVEFGFIKEGTIVLEATIIAEAPLFMP